jgi:nicotinamide-nucleotide amidase
VAAEPRDREAPVFPTDLHDDARKLLQELRAAALQLATAESCTGGLLAALLTEIPGSSDVLDRGFVTYSNDAKIECLGVHPELIERHGAVSAEVARAMAEGALVHSNADLTVAVTGVAGPGGGTAKKPVGLVHLAAAATGRPTLHRALSLGDIGRAEIRIASLRAAIELVRACLMSQTG